MDRAKRARITLRAKVTRLCNEIEAELKTQVPYKKTLLDLEEKLTAAKEKLVAKDKDVEEAMLDEGRTDQELEDEDMECDQYIDKIRDVKRRVEYAITPQMETSASSGGNICAGDRKEESRSYKLPKIELPKFNGDLKSWLGWWSQFEKIHKDPKLHSSDKFQYLIQATEEKSEPREMITVFPPTGDNYAAAVESLQRRYGREGLQLQVYLRELLQLVVLNVTKKDKIPLDKLYMKLESHIRALNTLDLSKAEPSMYFYPLVESSLPEEVLRTWLRHVTTDPQGDDAKKNKLEDLMNFIKREVEGEQQIQLAQNAFQTPKGSNARAVGKNKRSESPTAASLHTGSVSPSSCAFCGKSNHNSADCFKARKMTLEEKRKKLQEGRCCFNCLSKGHGSKQCKAPVQCFLCDQNHVTIMCYQAEKKKTEKPNVEQITEEVKNTMLVQTSPMTSSTNVSSVHHAKVVLMKTLHVKVQGTNGVEREVRLLFDEGSQCSYIKTELAEDLRCKKMGELRMQNSLFGGQVTAIKSRDKLRVQIRGVDDKYAHRKKDVILVNENLISNSCPIIPQGPWIDELDKKNICVTDTWANSREVEILIGSDLWGSIMTGKMVKLKGGLVAVESIFGWTLSGLVRDQFEQSCASLITTLTITEEKSLPDLWSLELLGIQDSPDRITQEEEDLQMKETFQENITQNPDGRYVVKLPWTCDSAILSDNRFIAQKRLENATKRLRDQNEYENYDQIFEDWLKEGIIEQVHVQSINEHFLPHRPVFKPESLTTPVRPVFDASCKTNKGPSLNDCLTKGPNLLELIPSILLRFRQKEIGVISDIRKAFQMIEVQSEDRNYQKFIWWEDPVKKIVKIFRHSRVVFGMNCSPFMLAAVLDFHLKNVKEEMKPTAETLQKSLYVDNSVTSFYTAQEYEDFRQKSVEILMEAKMELRQWETNLENARAVIENTVTSVLGLKWNKQEDVLYCQLPKNMKSLDQMKITKRNVLSLVSQVYDPIGFTCPAIILPKLQIQESWALKTTWDEEW